jgi:hypothetical protein
MLPLVIHILVPESTQSDPSCRANVRTLPRVGTVVGLGEAEAADRLLGRHPGQPLSPLFLRPVPPDRVHGQGAQAVRRTRLRRTPYRGQPKTHLANVLSATAINLIRVDAWLNGTPLGTTRVSHLARLDLAA